jgi:hypothetical protein
MGEDDINVHDQWAVESMGAIQDRTREHLGTSDKVIMANRRTLLQAIETVRSGGTPPMALTPPQAAATTGPDTIDCIAPAQGWHAHWQQAVAARRAAAPWLYGTRRPARSPQPAHELCPALRRARHPRTRDACQAVLRRVRKPASSRCVCPGPTCTAAARQDPGV